ncbi:hypothetical protein TNCV_2088751 [Trichonephila clavipes]|nr:hypothetical protein TNCV_2088751 [Trichonephila clavipes]
MAFSCIISLEKARAEKSHFEIMLLTCFDSQGSIHKELLPDRTTMNVARTIHRPLLSEVVKRRVASVKTCKSNTLVSVKCFLTVLPT